jgi:hypothetical protein
LQTQIAALFFTILELMVYLAIFSIWRGRELTQEWRFVKSGCKHVKKDNLVCLSILRRKYQLGMQYYTVCSGCRDGI